MKLTIEIPSEHTAEILAVLAKLMKPTTMEVQPNPAEGHPELPLEDVSIAYRPLTTGEIIKDGDICITPKGKRCATDCISEIYMPKPTGSQAHHLPHFRPLKGLDRREPSDESEEIAETRWAATGIEAI